MCKWKNCQDCYRRKKLEVPLTKRWGLAGSTHTHTFTHKQKHTYTHTHARLSTINRAVRVWVCVCVCVCVCVRVCVSFLGQSGQTWDTMHCVAYNKIVLFSLLVLQIFRSAIPAALRDSGSKTGMFIILPTSAQLVALSISCLIYSSRLPTEPPFPSFLAASFLPCRNFSKGGWFFKTCVRCVR